MASSSSYKKYETRKRDPDPKSAVLLVIDMQNYFYSMGKPILPAIKTTIDLCRRNSVPVIFTRHRHKSPEDYGMIYEWWNGDIIRDGTVEAELVPELDRRDGDLVVEKHTYSAFRAREAFVRGFRVFFSTDATATSSAELHDATLKNLAYGNIVADETMEKYFSCCIDVGKWMIPVYPSSIMCLIVTD
ncbi:hypothetical protein RDI58_000306 [Solanum bulbocastanum]|uniref:Isochorismatase-like domain-containing protein n=1 Tax=Solanum bulbocastanum TaxID=147425 RepID=A0AAN8UAS5_SOLBU